MPEIKRKKVLLTLLGGGFMWQSNTVFQGLTDIADIAIVIPTDSKLLVNKLKIDQKIDPNGIHYMHPLTTISGTQLSYSMKIQRFLITLYDCWTIIRRVNPDVVICNASSVAIPLFLVAKLLQKKTIFIESITRVTKASTTGKLLDAMHLCDRLYVQWPELVSQYRRAVYQGNLI